MTVESKIRIGFGSGLAFLVLTSAVAYWSVTRSVETFRSVELAEHVLNMLGDTRATMLDVETGARGFVITGNERFLAPFDTGRQEILESLRDLRQATAESPDQQQHLDRLERLIADRLSHASRLVELRRTEGFDAAEREAASGAGREAMDSVRRAIGDMEALELNLLAARTADANTTARTTIVLVSLWGLLALLVVGIATLVVRSDFARRRQAEEQRDRFFAEIAQLNGDLQNRASLLEEANEELDAFSYSVSHDLRAPLRHIKGFVDLLDQRAGTALDDKGRHFLEVISESAERMEVLVNDLLAFSRMGRAEMIDADVDLDALVRDSIQSLESETRERNIAWTIGALPHVHGDPAMLRQVMINLVANAVKYTRTRQRAEIEIGTSQTPHEHVLFTRDNGVGFDAEEAHRLFGVFQRLHRVEEFEGTGIGLANVRRIIHRHGGRTWAEGKVGGGATFYFSLPKAAPSRNA